MKRFFPSLVFLVLLFNFCGKKGNILPPLEKIPEEIKELLISQKGESVLLEWVNPKTYLDGSPLPDIAEVEIFMLGEEVDSPMSDKSYESKKFETRAKRIATIRNEELSEFQMEKKGEQPWLRFSYKVTRKDFLIKKLEVPLFGSTFIISKRLTFGLRIKDKKKRQSMFSKLLSINPAILSLPPQDLRTTLFKERIEIMWKRPQKNTDKSSPPNILGYNIYREEGEDEPQKINSGLIRDRGKQEDGKSILLGKFYLISLVIKYMEQWTKYDDRGFLFGKTYRYFVRASANSSSPFLESENSEVIEIFTKDTFPPDIPSGLVSIAGESFITLSWEANLESDFVGFRVWRRQDGENEYILLTPQPIKENSYHDRTVEKNMRYYYAISAQDISGNESQKSESVSEIIKDGLP